LYPAFLGYARVVEREFDENSGERRHERPASESPPPDELTPLEDVDLPPGENPAVEDV
jgi:hypothetical protein